LIACTKPDARARATSQVGHDDRAAEHARRRADDRGELRAVAQMQVPVVRAAQDEPIRTRSVRRGGHARMVRNPPARAAGHMSRKAKIRADRSSSMAEDRPVPESSPLSFLGGSMLARTSLFLALTLAAAQAYALEKIGPTWSEVTGQRYTRTTMNRMPAIVKSIDGDDTTYRIVKITPGDRLVRLQSPSRKGFQGTDQELRLTAEPCKRYYLNAQFDSGSSQNWQPVIDHVETIPGCKPGGARK
jgi:hypothetical protein